MMMSLLFDDEAQLEDEFRSTAFSSDDVRMMERPLLERGIPLMRMAASAVATTARIMLRQANVPVDDARVVLLAGGGDNGGDGLFAAAELVEDGMDVTVIAVGRTLHDEGLAAFDEACGEGGGEVLVLDGAADIHGFAGPHDDDEAEELFDEALETIENAHLVIDAMTGIGVSGALRGLAGRLAAETGADGMPPTGAALPSSELPKGFPLVLAVDIPSGVGVDDGTLPGPYIPADVTVTFGALKPCALLPPSTYICGRLALVDFGFDTGHFSPAVEMVTRRTAAQALRLPRITDSKYSRGVVGLITGSDSYPGAAVLSACAAARTNVGMIRYHGPARAQDLVLQRLPEAVMGTGRVQAWAVGSGVPDDSHAAPDDAQRQAIASLLARYDANNEQPGDLPPIVVDAGALDLIPDSCPPQVLITPHAGELARLISERDEDLTADDVMAAPLTWATRAWELTGATVLLKGAVTVVVGDDGTGDAGVFVAGRGPAWLSTAGAGDVLAGMTVGLLAQASPLLTLHPDQTAIHAAVAAYLHGLSAGIAASSQQMGRDLPVVYDSEDVAAFAAALTGFEADGPSAETTGSRTAEDGTLGRPIIAQDIVSRLPDALASLIAMYDDPRPDGGDDERSDI